MQISPNIINVWVVNLNISDELEKQQFENLSLDEQAQAKRFVFPIHQKRFVASHFALRNLLSRIIDVSPQEVHFILSEHGKPYLENHPNIGFNLSHSEEVAVIGLQKNARIGIDIEKIQLQFNLKLVHRFFSQEEINEFNEIPTDQQLSAFFRFWSRKEAIIKALGTGLSFPLNQFTTSLKNNYEMITIASETWHLLSLDYFTDYQFAIASDQTFQLELHHFDSFVY